VDECTTGDIIGLKKDIYKEMIQYQLVKNDIAPEVFKMVGIERPPMINTPEYRKKSGQSPPPTPPQPLAPEEKTA